MNTTPRYLANTDTALRHGWHPVALSTEIGDEPISVRLLGEPWAVARLDHGLAAFADHCPRRLVPPPAGRAERDEPDCPYHRWRFVVPGECTAIPPRIQACPGTGGGDSSDAPCAPTRIRARATPPFGIIERHGVVWIAPEEPFADIIDVPEVNNPAFDSVWLPVARTSACASLLADAFLDTTRFSPVPAATASTTKAPLELAADYRVDADGGGFRATMETDAANPDDPGVARGIRPLMQRRSSKYVFRPPFMLRRRVRYPDAGTTNTVLLCLQPEDDDTTRIYTRILRDDIHGDAALLAEAVHAEQAMIVEHLALWEKLTDNGRARSSGAAGSEPVRGSGSGEGAERGPATRSRAEGMHTEWSDAHTDATRAALRQALAALADRAEKRYAQASRRAGPARLRYARRASFV